MTTESEPTSGGEPAMLSWAHAPQMGFAAHQADIPLLLEIRVQNRSDAPLCALELRLSASPPVFRPQIWPIDRIEPWAERTMKHRRLEVEGGLLAELDERMRSDLRLELWQGESLLAERTSSVVALARNEWGGTSALPELLAAFVLPNDPAVATVLQEASAVLAANGRCEGFEGYRSEDRRRVWEMIEAIWGAVAARRLTYAVPPASFERNGQKIRSPSDVLGGGIACCLDLAVLFAAAAEQAGLQPVLALSEGHALSGVWLQPHSKGGPFGLTTEDPMPVRKAIDGKELVLFETTLAAQSSLVPFSKAAQRGRRQVEEEAGFVCALDVFQARARQILPLPAKGTSVAATDAGPTAMPTMEPPPELPGFDFGLDLGEVVETPAGRVDRWKRKLLDLTKRNRLLHMKPGRFLLPFHSVKPKLLAAAIASGKKLSFVVLPEGKERDETQFQLRTGEDLAERFAEQAIERNELVLQLPPERLDGRLIEIYREAKKHLEEGGTNTLFVALGALRWQPAAEKLSHYEAPLVLVPVTLERTSVQSKPKLQQLAGEGAAFNSTLLEFLRQEFNLQFPEIWAEDGEMDVEQVLDLVRRRVADVPGFEVLESSALGIFSFAKYLMWKDLDARAEQLAQSPLVHHLIHTPRDGYEGSASMLAPSAVDEAIDPSTLFAPLYADASQLVAIHASGTNGDFVIEGPPGTGKSETIGNIIAHNLGLGRRVLFVSEKRAALEVVYRRLCDKGLGSFCLELHSNKQEKRQVLRTLEVAWDECTARTVDEWQRRAAELKAHRDRLNGLVSALHAPGPTNLSPRTAIGRVVRYRKVHRLELGWGPELMRDDRAGDAEGLAALLDLANELGQQFSKLEPEDFQTFFAVEHRDWSHGWQADFVAAARTLGAKASELSRAAETFAAHLGLAAEDQRALRLDRVVALRGLAAVVPDAARFDLGFAVAPDAHETLERLRDGLRFLDAYRATESELSFSASEAAVASAPVSAWREALHRANRRWWPFSWFGRRALAKAVASHFFGSTNSQGGGGARPRLARKVGPPEGFFADFDRLEMMKAHRAELEALGNLPKPWRGLATSVEDIEAFLEVAERLGAAFRRLASTGEIASTRVALSSAFGDEHRMLEPGLPIAEAAADLGARLDAFSAASDGFSRLGGSPAGQQLDGLRQLADGIAARERRLNPWCQYVEARQRARAAGLESLVDAVEAGSVAPDQCAEQLN